MPPLQPNGLLLLGAGGHGRVVADIAETLGWTDIAFLDDAWPAREINGVWPIIGRLDALPALKGRYHAAFASLGDGALRLKAHRRLKALDFQCPSLAHPSAVVSRHASLGAGSVVVAGAVIGPFACVGEAVIINTGASIDHDCTLEDAVHISPGARLSGGVRVGLRAWIGVGAAVREGVNIGRDVMIGAGAAVVTDIDDGVMAIGVPARAR